MKHFPLSAIGTAQVLLIASILLSTLALSPHAKLRPRIIGGTAVPDREYNYTGILRIGIGDATFITTTVTLVSATTAITNVDSTYVKDKFNITLDASYVAFGTGEEFFQRAEHKSKIRRVAYHPAYNESTLENNIAVLVLDTPVPRRTASPIRVVTDREVAGMRTVVTGFGQTADFAGSAPPRRIMRAELVVGSTSYCRSGYRSTYRGEFCTRGVDGVGPCKGDGGAPLAVRTRSGALGLLGIYSRTRPTSGNPGGNCADGNNAPIHLRVSDYLDFIVMAADLEMGDVAFGEGEVDDPGSSDGGLGEDSEESSGVGESSGDTGGCGCGRMRLVANGVLLVYAAMSLFVLL